MPFTLAATESSAHPLPPAAYVLHLQQPNPALIHAVDIARALACQVIEPSAEPLTAAHLALAAVRLCPPQLRAALVASLAPSAYMGPVPSVHPRTPAASPAAATNVETSIALRIAAQPLYQAILTRFRIRPVALHSQPPILTARLGAAATLLPPHRRPRNATSRSTIHLLLQDHPPVNDLPTEALLDRHNPIQARTAAHALAAILDHRRANDPHYAASAPENAPPIWWHPSLQAPSPSIPPDPADIGAALACTPRYAGLLGPWSVAHHSILAARLSPPGHRLHALLHDAHEIYLGDIPTPTRRHIELSKPGFSRRLAAAKLHLDKRIRHALSVPQPGEPCTAEIHRADNAALDAELRHLAPAIPGTGHLALDAFRNNPPLPEHILRDERIINTSNRLVLAKASRADAASAFTRLLRHGLHQTR